MATKSGFLDGETRENKLKNLYRYLYKEYYYKGNFVVFSFRYDNSLLRQKVDKGHWEKHSLVALVNAFYDPSVNGMEFPAGILQGVFFDHRVPRFIIIVFYEKVVFSFEKKYSIEEKNTNCENYFAAKNFSSLKFCFFFCLIFFTVGILILEASER
jgi:hypothetical protein